MFKRLKVSFLMLLFPCLLLGADGNKTGQVRGVSISPDGKVVAVDFGKGSTSFIYMIALDTGKATRLTDAKTGAESGPAFSPDGKRIAYSYWSGNEAHSSIVIGNVDGSDIHPWSSEGSAMSAAWSQRHPTRRENLAYTPPCRCAPQPSFVRMLFL